MLESIPKKMSTYPVSKQVHIVMIDGTIFPISVQSTDTIKSVRRRFCQTINDVEDRSIKLVGVSFIDQSGKKVFECARLEDQNIIHAIIEEIVIDEDILRKSVGEENCRRLIENDSSLTSLSVYGQIHDINVQCIADVLKVNDTLKQFELASYHVNVEGCGYLADALEVNETLVDFSLIDDNIGDVGAQLFANALKVNETLTGLCLIRNNIGDRGAEFLADALKDNSTLTTLFLTRDNICDEGAKCLADALKVNKTLTTLWIEDNKIGDIGAEFLAEALKVNSTLTTLSIFNNNVSDVGAKFLTDAVKVEGRFLTIYF